MLDNIYIRIDDRQYITKFDRLRNLYYKSFCKIKIEKIKNGKIVLLPSNYLKHKVLFKKQIDKFLNKEKNENIIYSNEIDDSLKWNNGVSNITGKKLMKMLVYQIVEYIYNISRNNMELDDIYIFANQYNKESIEMIDRFVQHFKTVNIITSNISKFKSLEYKYERNNILITVSNNRRKSAQKARVIVNVDFDNKSFEKYKINNNAIIINLINEKFSANYNFNGIIINDYNIRMSEDFFCYIEEFYGNINMKLWMEGIIDELEDTSINKLLKKQHIKISELVGIRGVIEKEEFTNSLGKNKIYI